MSAGQLQLFLPCAGGVEPLLAAEILGICPASQPHTLRGGVLLEASWREALLLNLHSRLAQRVLIQLARAPYRQ
ncbi:MAG: THUMP domain-containing protein, partial [Comamonas sp.]